MCVGVDECRYGCVGVGVWMLMSVYRWDVLVWV